MNVSGDGYLYYGDKAPELRFTQNGIAMLRGRVSYYQGKDKPKGFIDITFFNELAENVAESIKHGDSITFDGRLEYREWDSDDGQKRSGYGIVANNAGASLRWNTVQVVAAASSQPTRQPARKPAIAAPEEAPF